MAMAPLTLVANPGSASRKYALYNGDHLRAALHFEWAEHQIICTLHQRGERQQIAISLENLNTATAEVLPILQEHGVLQEEERITHIGLRIVAPGGHFLRDHQIDDTFVAYLRAAQPHAPLHITATLEELRQLRKHFAHSTIFGISDSAFHLTKPDHAWNYGLPLDLADQHDIKRFGYHGLSLASVVHTLRHAKKMPNIIVCHLGSGASVTAIRHGKSLDTTMGYSPLEGLIMSTRSGSIDPTAVRALKEICQFSDKELEAYLHHECGLRGLGGSDDIRELLQQETQGYHRAHLALQTYAYNVQKAIGSMAAALNGADGLVFTGTVGERSVPMRARIAEHLQYLGFTLDHEANAVCGEAHAPTPVSASASKPILVVPTDESGQIARQVQSLAQQI